MLLHTCFSVLQVCRRLCGFSLLFPVEGHSQETRKEYCKWKTGYRAAVIGKDLASQAMVYIFMKKDDWQVIVCGWGGNLTRCLATLVLGALKWCLVWSKTQLQARNGVGTKCWGQECCWWTRNVDRGTRTHQKVEKENKEASGGNGPWLQISLYPWTEHRKQRRWAWIFDTKYDLSGITGIW